MWKTTVLSKFSVDEKCCHYNVIISNCSIDCWFWQWKYIYIVQVIPFLMEKWLTGFWDRHKFISLSKYVWRRIVVICVNKLCKTCHNFEKYCHMHKHNLQNDLKNWRSNENKIMQSFQRYDIKMTKNWKLRNIRVMTSI